MTKTGCSFNGENDEENSSRRSSVEFFFLTGYVIIELGGCMYEGGGFQRNRKLGGPERG